MTKLGPQTAPKGPGKDGPKEINHDGNHVALRVGEFGGDGAGQGDTHAGEAVGDDAGVGVVATEHTCHPHFVGTHVAYCDILRLHRGAQIPDDLLRFDGELGVITTAVHLTDQRLA